MQEQAGSEAPLRVQLSALPRVPGPLSPPRLVVQWVQLKGVFTERFWVRILGLSPVLVSASLQNWREALLITAFSEALERRIMCSSTVVRGSFTRWMSGERS